MKTAAFLLLLGFGIPLTAREPVDFKASPKLQGENLPERPALPDAHKEPFKGPLAEALQKLLDAGLPDPSGLPYHHLEIATGNCYTGDSGITKIEGWLIPREDKEPAFMIAWNGLIYPVISDKGEADLDATMKAVKESKADRKWAAYENASETGHVSGQAELLFNGLYFTLLGHDDMVAALAPEGVTIESKSATAWLADQWAWAHYERAVYAHMRGDSHLVLASLQELDKIRPKLLELIEPGLKEGSKAMSWNRQEAQMIADNKRRIDAKSSGDFDEKPFLKTNPSIEQMIAALDQLAIPQGGQPADVPLGYSPLVRAFALKGNDAVEPLLECLAHDQRLTRSMHFWRDFSQDRTILGVQEPALYALEELLHQDFFRLGSTGDSLTSRSAEKREELAGKIREQWEKSGKTAGLDRVYEILKNPETPLPDWVNAASGLFPSRIDEREKGAAPLPLPGEVLRDRKDPSVSDLFEKRIERTADVKKRKEGDSSRYWVPLFRMYADWDREHGKAKIVSQVRRWMKDDAWSHETPQTLMSFIESTVEVEPEALIVFDKMAWGFPASKYSEDAREGVEFLTTTLRDHGDSEMLKHKPEDLWMSPNSPWSVKKLKADDLDELVQIWVDDQVVNVEPFRTALLTLLADPSPTDWHLGIEDDKWFITSHGGRTEDDIPQGDDFSLKAGKSPAVRRMDLVSHVLGDRQNQHHRGEDESKVPVLKLYWPPEKRDAFVAAQLEEMKKAPAQKAKEKE